jgi:hypothetical protein
MENWEIQKPGFLDKTPSFSDVPAFLAVLGSPGTNHRECHSQLPTWVGLPETLQVPDARRSQEWQIKVGLPSFQPRAQMYHAGVQEATTI